MNVLHIISSGGMYGAEAVILNLSRILNQSGHRSSLGVFANARNPNLQLHEIAQRESVESYLISCKGQIDLSVPRQIRELVRRCSADVVHAHGYKADIYTWAALRGSRTPFVSTCHTWFDNDHMVKLYGAADRLVLRNFGHVIAVSEEVRQRLLEASVRPERISLIANGVSLGPFTDAVPSLRSPGDAGTLFIGLVGRLSREKGIDIFIEAAEIVLQQFPEVRFFVAGEGPERPQLEAMIGQRGLGSQVTLLGRRDDIPSVYASLDILVSASRQEGLPIAILEGMASARPIVATSVGEIPLLIHDGRTGRLVAPGDAQVLAAAISALLTDPAERSRLGAAAREHVVRNFSAESMTAEYMRIYEAAVAETLSRAGAGRTR